MDKNKKYLRLYVKDYTFANSEELYNRDTYKKLRNHHLVKTTKLYAIVKTKKIIFDKKTCKIDKNYKVICDILADNKVYKIEFNLLELYYEQFGQDFYVYEDFKNKLEDILLNTMDFGENITLTKDNLYKQISLYNDQQNDKNLTFVCPFYYVICGKKTALITLNIYRIINLLKIDCVNDLEILYIGKSMKDTMKRLKNHNKWGEIFTLDKKYQENYDYLIYVFNIDKADTHINHLNEKNIFLLNIDSNIDLQNAVKNLEIAFISYYKPLLNEKHIDTNFSKTTFVTKELINLGYTNLIVEMNLGDESIMGKIKTSSVDNPVFEIDITL